MDIHSISRWCQLSSIALLLTACESTDTAHHHHPSNATITDSIAAKSILGLPAIAGLMDHLGLQGGVHIWNTENQIEYHSDSASYYKKNVPASTFKIFISLMSLEQGLLKDQYEIKAWKNRIQKNEDWNKDQDLKEAFAQSTNWFFEDLAQFIGPDSINGWLERIDYPARIQPGISKFWLDPSFVISPAEQIKMMQKLHQEKMPFSKRSMDITKDIMLRLDTLNIKVYGKTGWGTPNNGNVGWYVGWVEQLGHNPTYFATCIEQAEPAHAQFDELRKYLTYLALAATTSMPAEAVPPLTTID